MTRRCNGTGQGGMKSINVMQKGRYRMDSTEAVCNTIKGGVSKENRLPAVPFQSVKASLSHERAKESKPAWQDSNKQTSRGEPGGELVPSFLTARKLVPNAHVFGLR